MKVVVLDGFLVNYGLNGLPLGASHEVIWYRESPLETIPGRLAGAQAVFVNRTPLREAAFASPALRFAGVFGTGYNHIDLSAAARAGVTVCNVPAYSTEAVAQHTMSLLLNLCCRIDAHNHYVKNGLWKDLSDPPLAGRGSFELSGKTIGLVGYGNIARAVGRMARSFGMRVLAWRRHPLPEEGVTFTSLNQLLAASDVVSVHCPLTPETRGLINAEALSRMKHGAILLNTARGPVLDEEAVAQALDSGKLSMAGLDVFHREPPVNASSLAFHPRVIATPHVAWTPKETRERLLKISAENLLAFLRGTPQNVISKAAPPAQ